MSKNHKDFSHILQRLELSSKLFTSSLWTDETEKELSRTRVLESRLRGRGGLLGLQGLEFDAPGLKVK